MKKNVWLVIIKMKKNIFLNVYDSFLFINCYRCYYNYIVFFVLWRGCLCNEFEIMCKLMVIIFWNK